MTSTPDRRGVSQLFTIVELAGTTNAATMVVPNLSYTVLALPPVFANTASVM